MKIYAFYGEVGQVLVRAVGTHGDISTVRRSYYLPDGTYLETVSPLASGVAVPAPARLEQLCDAARLLSRHVALPIVRVDLYDAETGPVLRELTLAPGGKQVYTVEHDRMLGRLWEDAKTRLEVDALRDLAEEQVARARA